MVRLAVLAAVSRGADSGASAIGMLDLMRRETTVAASARTQANKSDAVGGQVSQQAPKGVVLIIFAAALAIGPQRARGLPNRQSKVL
jgi:phosphate/sulfate permease